jgi:phosphonate transport system substrate-binding protein
MKTLHYLLNFSLLNRAITYLCLTFILLGCLIYINPVYANDDAENQNRLNMGYYANSITENANRTDVEISLNIWANELLQYEHKNNGFNISISKATLYDTMEDMRAAFDRGELDLINAPPLLISKYFKREELADGFIGVLPDHRQESIILIARDSLNIKNGKDLQGKRVEINENDQLAVIFLDSLMLNETHSSYKDGAVSILKQQKSDRIVLDVYFNKADAGVVYGSAYELMAELNPDIKNKVTIVKTYPIKARTFSYFRRDYPFINELHTGELKFIKTVRGKQIMEVFRTPDIDYCTVDDLGPFEQLNKDYLALKKQAKKK